MQHNEHMNLQNLAMACAISPCLYGIQLIPIPKDDDGLALHLDKSALTCRSTGI